MPFWNKIAVTKILAALYVTPNNSIMHCEDKPFYRLLINDATADKLLHFPDGTTVRSQPYEVRWLPSGTVYRIERLATGSCWGICFELQEDPGQPFFNMRLRNPEPVLRLFQEAAQAFFQDAPLSEFTVRKCLYNIFDLLIREQETSADLRRQELLIQPAVQEIRETFSSNGGLSVKDLAQKCGISENYLRILFLERFHMGPKEYILQMRMEQAKKLLLQKIPVNKVAVQCGYAEACHFSREFTKRVGMSPKAYQTAFKFE